MIVDYLHDINGYHDHILRISEFGHIEAGLFKQTLNDLLEKGEIDLEKMVYIKTVNMIRIKLRVSQNDLGITGDKDAGSFVCDLSYGGWKNAINLVEPFCADSGSHKQNSYQWLYDLDTPTDFLFSPKGAW